MKIKNTFCTLLVLVMLLFPGKRAKADLFGGDVAVLTQILVQAIQQLAQLKQIWETANGEYELLQQINRGINDSLNIIRTIDPNIDPGIYKDWNNAMEALSKLEGIYGIATQTSEVRVQKDLDQGIAEAISFNNSYYKYTKSLDEIGEAIKSASHDVSPGGASKLTAQALGLVIQVLNQNLRAQATGLKLHAQELAIQNRKDKEGSKHFMEASTSLRTAMQNEKISFQVPRF